jgi:hypothetical protein
VSQGCVVVVAAAVVVVGGMEWSGCAVALFR